MTIEQMAESIVEAVNKIGGGVSLVEIVDSIGDEARGDHELGYKDLNVVLWSGVSENFIKAINLAKPHIYQVPTQPLVYSMDGNSLTLPIVKHLETPYEEPHWLPVVFWPRKSQVIQGMRANCGRKN